LRAKFRAAPGEKAGPDVDEWWGKRGGIVWSDLLREGEKEGLSSALTGDSTIQNSRFCEVREGREALMIADLEIGATTFGDS
jgi:hypothetical protein